MVGKYNSVTALFKQELNDLIVIKCVSHSLHLCAEKAAETLPRQLEFLVRESHNWFSYSPKRLEYYRDIQHNKQEPKSEENPRTQWYPLACPI